LFKAHHVSIRQDAITIEVGGIPIDSIRPIALRRSLEHATIQRSKLAFLTQAQSVRLRHETVRLKDAYRDRMLEFHFSASTSKFWQDNW